MHPTLIIDAGNKVMNQKNKHSYHYGALFNLMGEENQSNN